MVFSMVFTFMPGQTVKAADIGPGDYSPDDFGSMSYVVNSESETKVFDTVTVPEGCMLTIETDVTIGTLHLDYDSQLNILGDGRLTYTTINAQHYDENDKPGSRIMFEKKENIPTSLQVFDGENDMSSSDYMWEGDWKTVEYMDDNQWHLPEMPSTYKMLNIDGYNWDGTLTISYSFDDGATYTQITEIRNGEPQEGDIAWYMYDEAGNKCGVEVDFSPLEQDMSNFAIQFELSDSNNKVIADANIDWGRENIFDCVSLDGKTLIYKDSDERGSAMNIGISLAYLNEGLSGIVDEAKNYIYAYDSVTAGNLAIELYDRFLRVPMFERFGFRVLPPDGLYNDEVEANNIAELTSRIIKPVSPSSTVSVIKKDGTTATRNVYNCTVNWGTDRWSGEAIVSTIPVIELIDPDELIICTDWKPETGFGAAGSFYSRIMGTDQVKSFEDDGSDKYSVSVDDYGKVIVGGNNGRTNKLNTENLYSLTYINEYRGKSAVIRVLKKDNSYVALTRDPGSDNVDGLGINGSSTDEIWNTGADATAIAFIGDENIYLEPLSDASGIDSAKAIASVTLKDESMKDGVTIDATNVAKIKVSFASNFYDSVPLVITYSDGTQKELTINRVGLVIQYIFLDDSNHFEIEYSCNGTSSGLDYTCWDGDPDRPETWSAREQVLIYATYYHPSSDATTGDSSNLYLSLTYDDGHTDIISHVDTAHNFNGYTPASSGKVATTSFIIGFAHSKELHGFDWEDITSQTYVNKFGNAGGFSATVLNAGYDNITTYGGTQVGSGAGVYWDGKITWFE